VATAEFNAFYRGPEGMKQHIKLVAADEVDPETNITITAQEQVLRFAREIPASLIQQGATREESANGLPQPVQQPQQQAPRPQQPQNFQPQATGAGVARIHQACGNPMQFVPAGVSRSTNRAYPAFFKCGAGCKGANNRDYTENA
jgi:hypothetical protein